MIRDVLSDSSVLLYKLSEFNGQGHVAWARNE